MTFAPSYMPAPGALDDPRVVIVSCRWRAKYRHVAGPHVVEYVGRENGHLGLVGSPLGNPYRATGDSLEERQEAVAQFKTWLDEQLGYRTSAATLELLRLTEIVRGGNKLVLQCWCAPLPCHAEVIRDKIFKRLDQ